MILITFIEELEQSTNFVETGLLGCLDNLKGTWHATMSDSAFLSASSFHGVLLKSLFKKGHWPALVAHTLIPAEACESEFEANLIHK